MLQAVSFALADSINVLLIGVLFALGVMHPRPRKYARVAGVLVAGDWFGVFLLSVLTLAVFGGISDWVQAALASPVIGLLLLALAVVTVVLTIRGGDSSAMVARLASPLRSASWSTFVAGMGLGLIQSATSLPFFVGLAYLSAEAYPLALQGVGSVFYAALALSLPSLVAVLIGLVLRFPESVLGRALAGLRTKQAVVTKFAGYVVAALLAILGVVSLLH